MSASLYGSWSTRVLYTRVFGKPRPRGRNGSGGYVGAALAALSGQWIIRGRGRQVGKAPISTTRINVDRHNSTSWGPCTGPVRPITGVALATRRLDFHRGIISGTPLDGIEISHKSIDRELSVTMTRRWWKRSVERYSPLSTRLWQFSAISFFFFLFLYSRLLRTRKSKYDFVDSSRSPRRRSFRLEIRGDSRGEQRLVRGARVVAIFLRVDCGRRAIFSIIFSGRYRWFIGRKPRLDLLEISNRGWQVIAEPWVE